MNSSDISRTDDLVILRYFEGIGSSEQRIPQDSERNKVSVSNGQGGSYPADTPFAYTSLRRKFMRGSSFAIRERLDAQDGWVPVERTQSSGPQSAPRNDDDLSVVITLNTVRQKAAEQLMSKMKDGSLNLGSDSAEALKSAQDARKRMEGASDYTNRKPLPRSVPIGALKVGSSAWLAWTYAIKPSIDSAWTAATYVFKDNPEIITVKGNASNSHTQQRTTRWSDDFDGFSTSQSLETHYVTKYKARFTVDDAILANLANITSFNPALLAWDTVSLSFVADWFVNVGGYMEQMEWAMGMGLKILSVTESSLARTTRTRVFGGSKTTNLSPTSRTRLEYGLQEIRKDTTFYRSVGSSLPRPMLTGAFVPESKGNLGSSRLISAAALLSNFISPSARK